MTMKIIHDAGREARMEKFRRLLNYLALAGIIVFVLLAVIIMTSATNRISHYILEDILETVCCFIPALLMGATGSSTILLGRRRI